MSAWSDSRQASRLFDNSVLSLIWGRTIVILIQSMWDRSSFLTWCQSLKIWNSDKSFVSWHIVYCRHWESPKRSRLYTLWPTIPCAPCTNVSKNHTITNWHQEGWGVTVTPINLAFTTSAPLAPWKEPQVLIIRSATRQNPILAYLLCMIRLVP